MCLRNAICEHSQVGGGLCGGGGLCEYGNYEFGDIVQAPRIPCACGAPRAPRGLEHPACVDVAQRESGVADSDSIVGEYGVRRGVRAAGESIQLRSELAALEADARNGPLVLLHAVAPALPCAYFRKYAAPQR